MPLFYFCVDDQHTPSDDVEIELNNEGEARSEALLYAGKTLTDVGQLLATGYHWRLQVKDASRAVLFAIEFSVLPAPILLQTLRPATDWLASET